LDPGVSRVLPVRQIGLFENTHPNRVLRGRVVFKGLAFGAASPSSAEVRATPEVGDPLLFPFTPLDANGNFQRTLPLDRYVIAIRSASWLRRMAFVDLTESDVVDFEIALEAGDAYPDNAVEVRDLNKVLVYFGLPGADYSDLNRDGATDILDLNIVLTNFGLVGEK